MPSSSVTRITQTYAVRRTSGGQPLTSQAITGFTFKSAKVGGSWKVLPNGGKFRCATPLSRARVTGVPGGQASEEATYTKPYGGGTERSYSYSGPGGYGSPLGDAVHSSGTSGVKGRSGLRAQPTSIPLDQRNEAVTKALLKLADGQAQVGENLATLGQTVRMLRNPLDHLVKGLNSVKRDKSLIPYLRKTIRDVRREGLDKAAARRYLEYVYGWKPLMQDIFNLVQLAKKQGVDPLLIRGTGKSVRSYQLEQNYSFGWSANFKGSGSETHTVRCSIYAYVDPEWATLRALNQLGLLNPASLAWELVSYSFVVDWVIPIGSLLNAMSATVGLSFVDGTISDRTRMKLTSRSQLVYLLDYPGLSNRSEVTSSWDVSGDYYIRQTLSSFPRPGLWIDPDPLRLKSDNSDRGFKAIALGIQRLR